MGKKKKKVVDDEGGDDFMLMFTALMIIVLAFFILLVTMAVIDDGKKREALGSLRGSFGILPGGNAFDKEGKAMSQSGRVSEDVVVMEGMVSAIKATFKVTGNALEADDVRLDASGLYPRLTLASDLLYGDDGRAVSPKAFPALDLIANASRDLDARLVVEGHTGTTAPPPRPGVPSNWELSTFRALNVGRYFTEAGEIPAHDVSVEGVAQYRSKDPKHEVVIVFQYGKARDKRKATDPKAKP